MLSARFVSNEVTRLYLKSDTIVEQSNTSVEIMRYCVANIPSNSSHLILLNFIESSQTVTRRSLAGSAIFHILSYRFRDIQRTSYEASETTSSINRRVFIVYRVIVSASRCLLAALHPARKFTPRRIELTLPTVDRVQRFATLSTI